MRGSWAVQYTDGEYLAQYDPKAGEISTEAIEWERVDSLLFESQHASTRLTIPPAPEGSKWALRSRNWISTNGSRVSAFVLTASSVGLEVNADSVEYALFWFPDGTVHETPFFNSHEADEYGSGVHPKRLVAKTGALRVSVDAVTQHA